MEKQRLTEVFCETHGVLAIVSQALLGVPVLQKHSEMEKGKYNAYLRPKEMAWQQRKQMRRITKTGK